MKQYLDVLKKIMNEGTDRPDRTGVGSRAIFGVPMRFNMADGFPAVTTKKLAFEAVKAELLWFLSGSNDVKELQKLGCHIWDGNANADYWKPKAKFEGDLGRVYGVQWRKWKSPYTDVPIDQIAQVIDKIKNNPIASYFLLLHMVAKTTGLKAWEFLHILGDAHVYLDHLE